MGLLPKCQHLQQGWDPPWGTHTLWEGVAGSPRAPRPAISSMGIVPQKIHQPSAGCTGAFQVYQGCGQGQCDIQGHIQLVGCPNPWGCPSHHGSSKSNRQISSPPQAAQYSQHSKGQQEAGGQGRHSMGSFLRKFYI